jgi:hypothetical protein
MLVQHVYPEFKSPVGHLRAKVRISDYTTTKGYSINEEKEPIFPCFFIYFTKLPCSTSITAHV